jgi:hypothetical protein
LDRPSYINWFVKEDACLEDGHPIDCYLIDYEINDDLLDSFALHIRRHYITDDELIDACQGMTVEDYLRQYCVPQKDEPKGPSTRSADISEIIVSDLIQFIYGYTVLRGKFHNRANKNSSEQGTDVIGYRFETDAEHPDAKDELIAVEVKASLSRTNLDILANAVKDSQEKDRGERLPRTLEFLRRKSVSSDNTKEAETITRFQSKSALPYKVVYGASAMTVDYCPDDGIILGITEESLSLKSETGLFLIHGEKLMELTHMVFERCIQ